jgi:hypothetical protein
MPPRAYPYGLYEPRFSFYLVFVKEVSHVYAARISIVFSFPSSMDLVAKCMSLDLRHNLSHGRKYTCYKTDGLELSSPYHGCDLRH